MTPSDGQTLERWTEPGTPVAAASGLPDDPRALADRYRALIGELDSARLHLAGQARSDQERREAGARVHRDAADAIRSRVEEVWAKVADPLAAYGITDLDQVRDATPQPGLHRGPNPRKGPDLRKHRSTALAARDLDQSGPDEPDPDPREAPRVAHGLCMDAMAQAAQLRAIARESRGLPVGLVIAVVCLLGGGAVAVTRLAAAVTAIPCLAGVALAAAVAVATLARGGRIMVVRAALLGGAAAGIAVLATARGLPSDPPGVIASIVLMAVAVRFGLGVGGRRT